MEKSPKAPVSQSEKSRWYALECMRLASDCVQLAQASDNSLLRKHYRQTAKEWIALAASGLPPHTSPERALRSRKAVTERAQTPEQAQSQIMDAIWRALANDPAAQTIH